MILLFILLFISSIIILKGIAKLNNTFLFIFVTSPRCIPNINLLLYLFINGDPDEP